MKFAQTFTPFRRSADFANRRSLWWAWATIKTNLRFNSSTGIFKNRSSTISTKNPMFALRLAQTFAITHLGIMFLAKTLASFWRIALATFLFGFQVQNTMGFRIRKQLKIFKSIIMPNPIFVMNDFCPLERSVQMICHNQSVFKNASTTVGIGMISNVNNNVSRRVFVHLKEFI